MLFLFEEVSVMITTRKLTISAMVVALYIVVPVSYTHLRAHETAANLVCRLLLEKKKHI